MKNKRLLFITIGLFMTIVCLLAINVLFPASKINKKEILLTRNSTLNEYFKNENIRIIPDSELNFYEIEERDIKTTDELNEDKEAKRNYEKTYFMYNINNQEIEIVGYKGNNPNLIIPSKIDGYNVTKVDLSKFNYIKSIFIPNTVTDIEGNFEYKNPDELSLIIVTMSNKNLEENFYNSTTYIFSIIYLMISLFLCFKNRIFYVLPNYFYVVYSVLTILYILLAISLRFYKNKLLNKEK